MTININIYTFYKQVLFGYPETRYQIRARLTFILTIYLLGVTYWLYFFNAGNIALSAYDWIKEG